VRVDDKNLIRGQFWHIKILKYGAEAERRGIKQKKSFKYSSLVPDYFKGNCKFVGIVLNTV